MQQAHQGDKFKWLGRRSASRAGRALISSSSIDGSKMWMAASMWPRSMTSWRSWSWVCSIWPARLAMSSGENVRPGVRYRHYLLTPWNSETDATLLGCWPAVPVRV